MLGRYLPRREGEVEAPLGRLDSAVAWMDVGQGWG